PAHKALERLEVLERDPLFKRDIPNYLRALYGQFARNNLSAFHATDGAGYKFLAERIVSIDKFNPQVASRIATTFSMLNRLDEKRQREMKNALNHIMESGPSKDTFE